MFPNGNQLAAVTMSGELLLKLLETSMEVFNDTSSTKGEFLHVSGMRVTYDITKEPGSRVKEVLIRDTNNPAGGLAQLNVSQSYQIGMPSIIASGGSRFTFMKLIPSQIISGNRAVWKRER